MTLLCLSVMLLFESPNQLCYNHKNGKDMFEQQFLNSVMPEFISSKAVYHTVLQDDWSFKGRHI